jgi:hypothetical protein
MLINILTRFVIIGMMALLVVSCADNSQTNKVEDNDELGSICTAEDLAQPAEDCTISLIDSRIDTKEELRKICQSPCNKVANGLSIIGIEGMTDLRALSRIQTMEYSELEISANPDLKSLDGLESLKSISHNLYIRENQSLKDISALSGLTKLGGSIVFQSNPQLESLKGLESLETVRNIYVLNNNKLQDILHFDSLETIDYLEVLDNPNLPACQIDILTERIEVERTPYVGGNGTGTCN